MAMALSIPVWGVAYEITEIVGKHHDFQSNFAMYIVIPIWIVVFFMVLPVVKKRTT